MRIGNSSSKYDYEPQKLDADTQRKLDVKEQLKADLRDVVHRDYHYRDDEGRMSYSAKRRALVEVVKELIEMMEG